MKTEEEQTMELQQKLAFYLKGDPGAVNFCLLLIYIAHTWDDLIDKDKPVSDEDIHKAFWTSLITLNYNQFFRANIDLLLPVMASAILQWLDANKLENMDERAKRLAYVYRASISQILNYCALLVGGLDWATKVGPDMRLLYEESFEDFKKSVKPCQIH